MADRCVISMLRDIIATPVVFSLAVASYSGDRILIYPDTGIDSAPTSILETGVAHRAIAHTGGSLFTINSTSPQLVKYSLAGDIENSTAAFGSNLGGISSNGTDLFVTDYTLSQLGVREINPTTLASVRTLSPNWFAGPATGGWYADFGMIYATSTTLWVIGVDAFNFEPRLLTSFNIATGAQGDVLDLNSISSGATVGQSLSGFAVTDDGNWMVFTNGFNKFVFKLSDTTYRGTYYTADRVISSPAGGVGNPIAISGTEMFGVSSKPKIISMDITLDTTLTDHYTPEAGDNNASVCLIPV